MTAKGRRVLRALLFSGIAAGVALGLGWIILADRNPVYEYQGPAPPGTGALTTERPPRLALVLGGGGPRGIAHIGVLKVLEKEGIVPDVIVGTSMGSVIGALYGADPNAARLERRALQISPWLQWRDLTLVSRPYLKGDAVEKMVREAVGAKTLGTLAIPLVAVATDVQLGVPFAFTRGDTAAAVRASSAIPGTFKRVMIAGREYFDGDFSAPVPVRVARGLGAQVVIAVDVMSHPRDMPEEMRNYPELILSDFYRHAINLRDLEQADVVISPRLGYYSTWSRQQQQHDILAGESAATGALPAVRTALAGGGVAAPTR
ncbi:MAG: patatin-like phospholipase family protein [Longimicrobiales bacterium]